MNKLAEFYRYVDTGAVYHYELQEWYGDTAHPQYRLVSDYEDGGIGATNYFHDFEYDTLEEAKEVFNRRVAV